MVRIHQGALSKAKRDLGFDAVGAWIPRKDLDEAFRLV